MKFENLNLPVMLTHNVDGVHYKIGGILKSINEEQTLCEVEFKNGRTEDIPIDYIYLTEGVWSKLKELGKKFSSWFVKKVKGFIAFCNKNGTYEEDPFNNIYNRAIGYAKGLLPKGAFFYPGQVVIDQLSEVGVDVPDVKEDKIFEYGIAEDAKTFNNYWHSVMTRAATTDDTIEESIDYVNKQWQHINEDGIYSLEEPVNKNMRTKKMYGREVNTAELKADIISNITSQLNYYTNIEGNEIYDSTAGDEHDEDDDIFAKIDNEEIDRKNASNAKKQFKEILFVWGAPGIGKTAIITQTLADFKRDTMTLQNGKTLYGRNLCLCTVNCSGFSDDSFMMPSPSDEVETDFVPDVNIRLSDEQRGGKAPIIPTTIKNNSFRAAPLSWLPVYVPGDDEYNRVMEHRFMTCQHLSVDGKTPLSDSEGDVYTGGILFLDEILRCRGTALNTIMALGRRNIQGYKLADSWAMICASNRGFESPDQEGLSLQDDQAQMQTFVHVNFVPTREEWLEWAMSPNATGWRSKVDSRILEFIQRGTSKHWYRCVSFGGYNDEIANALGASSDFTRSVLDKEEDDALGSDIVNRIQKLKPENNPMKTSVHWDGRILHAISREYQNAQIALFHYDHVEPSGAVVPGTLDNGKEAKKDRSKRYNYKWLVLQSVWGDCPTDKEGKKKWAAQIEAAQNNYKYRTTGISEDMYQKALAHLNPGVWKKWCENWLPADIANRVKNVDPTTLNFSRDIMDELLLSLVAKYTKDNYNNSFLYNSLKSDLEWRDKFSPAVVKSIYDFGFMPKENSMRKSDEWNQFLWKGDGKERDRKEIVDYLISNYDGDINADFSAYVKTVSNFITNLDGAITGLEGRKNVDIESVLKDVIDNLQDDSGKIAPYNDNMQKNLTKLFNVKFYADASNAERRKQIPLELINVKDIIGSSKEIFRMLYFICTKKKFVYKMVNVVKYIISMLDLNINNRHFCGEWKGDNDGEVDNFQELLFNLTNLSPSGKTDEKKIQSNISLILGRFKNNPTLKFLYVVDVFRLLMSCSKAAANYQVKTGVLGKEA